ncbi:hypothetical protein [Listeria newyorkensis]|uniref:Uncharacterized protein n=1 Tax=Listeria newyorkensis TaxID=1497681 RepID=A0A841Z3G2_9LIST|nr:hypothetical protein [Listeria newyorkensis]MBC1459353.1 hypothetical protein [Listeria newyorkensis]
MEMQDLGYYERQLNVALDALNRIVNTCEEDADLNSKITDAFDAVDDASSKVQELLSELKEEQA